MQEKKETRKFWFTVEGETEKWYLDWLEMKINENPDSLYLVSIVSKVQQNPLKFAKTVNPLSTPEITHWCDYESNDDIHVRKFEGILDQLKKSTRIGGKNFKYYLGYSNFTFELWMVLHKQDCNGSLSYRSQYIQPINAAYEEHFENLAHYKHEDIFNRIMKSLSLENVVEAVNRAKNIMSNNKENNWVLYEYKGYKYYKNNPSLTIWESVEKILTVCKIIDNT